VRGCHDAIERSGNNCRLSVVGNDFSVQNGYIETQLAIGAKQPPTAIFALSSTILLGVLKALNEHKLNIPDDVSVISFDDNTYLDYLNPPVTRIKQPVTDIAETAINLLIQAIAQKGQLQANICMAPSIVLRNSIKHLH
jgi:LacI family transcriptional regulator